MTKFRAGMISKLISKNAKAESEESEQEASSDDELVEETIFEKVQQDNDDDDDDDEVDDENDPELDDEALEDVRSDNDDDEENDEEEEDDDDDDDDEEDEEDNENENKESLKNNKRKAEQLDKKSAKKVKKDNNDEAENGDENGDDDDDDDDEEKTENGKGDKSEKKIREREPESPEKLKRTLFIGNLPHDFNKKVFKAMLTEYGPLQNFRIRSVAPSKESLSKKVAYLAGKLNPNKTTVNVYAVYKEPESVTKALSMNGKEFEKHILRVDRCTPRKVYQNTKSTIFVGNIPTKATDNQLHEFFSSCGQINKVRIIRDRETCAGKGIGYVEFDTKDAANAALEMNGQTFLNREIRVKEYYYKNNNNNNRFNQRRPFQGTQGQKKPAMKKRNNANGVQKAQKTFTGEQATKKHFQKKGKIIKAKNALAKKKNLAKILTKK